MNRTRLVDTDPALAAVLDMRVCRDQAEVNQLVAVLDWAAQHEPKNTGDEAAYADTEMALAGEGAPLVSEFGVYELAAVLRMTPESGKAYVGKALELKHRLPRIFGRVISGDVQVWRALRIAEATLNLPADGATHVDRALWFCADKFSWAQLDRTVEEALATFDPDEAEARRVAAADGRKVDVHLGHAGLNGTVDVTGTLDLADALDLEKALQQGASRLKAAGSEESLDVRRSMALGEMARGDLTLDLDTTASGTAKGRSVVIYAHLSESAVARLRNTGQNVMATQIQDWCGAATKVVVKPVIDLADCDLVESYDIPDRVSEQVDLRDHTCVFPWCTKPAHRCDHDHVTPWPRGQTCPCQIAPLCRSHHRAKTHAAWTYVVLDPGVYLWRSPTGYTFLRDHHGTSEP